jgi:HK97 family phage prohead protease
MPYPNEHAARLKDPKSFDSGTYKRTHGGKLYNKIIVPSSIDIIWGKSKGATKPNDPIIPQALRFPKSKWSVSKAKKWLSDNKVKYILFEPASGGKLTMKKLLKGHVKTIDASLQDVKAIENEEGRFVEGYFTTKDPDRGGDITDPKAFSDTMKIFKKNPVVTFMHDWKKPMGSMIDFKEDKKGVWVKLKIAEGVQWIDDMWTLMKQDVVKALSFGYRILKASKTEVSGKTYNLLEKLELLEIAVVTVPMNSEAIFTVTKSGGIKSIDLVQPDKKGEDILPLSTMSFEGTKFSFEEAVKLINESEHAKDMVKNYYKDSDNDHVFELYPGVTITKELASNLKEGISIDVEMKEETEVTPPEEKEEEKEEVVEKNNEDKEQTVEDEEKGVLKDTLKEREKKRASNLYDIFFLCATNLIKINPEDKVKAQKTADGLLEEFAIIAKSKALDFVKYQQEMLERAGITDFKEIDNEKILGINRISTIAEETDEKAGRVLSATNKKLIKECLESMTGATGMLGNLLKATEEDDPPKNDDEEEELTKEDKEFLESLNKDVKEQSEKLVAKEASK